MMYNQMPNIYPLQNHLAGQTMQSTLIYRLSM